MTLWMPRSLVTAITVACLLISLPSFDKALAQSQTDNSNPFAGLYVGLHLGSASIDSSGIYHNGGTDADPFDLSKFNLDTAMIGGQLGYNKQFGMFVAGIEAGASHGHKGGNLTAQTTSMTFYDYNNLDAKLDYTFSLRGRLGITFGNVMAFGTLGWAHAQYSYSSTLPPGYFDFLGPNKSIKIDTSGAVFGGGLEYAYNNVMFRVEYLHYDVGTTKRFSAAELANADAGDVLKIDDIDVVRFAINLKLQ